MEAHNEMLSLVRLRKAALKNMLKVKRKRVWKHLFKLSCVLTDTLYKLAITSVFRAFLAGIY